MEQSDYDTLRSNISQLMLKIAVDNHLSEMMRLEKKRIEVVQAEFAGKMVKIIRERYPDLLSDEALEAIRQDFLTHIFEI